MAPTFTPHTVILDQNFTVGTLRAVYDKAATSSDTFSGNVVTISAGTVRGEVYGVDTKNANVSGSTVTLSGTAQILNGSVYGGEAGGDVTDNKVQIEGSASVTGNVYGGLTGSGTASKNRVTLTGGTVGGSLRGGSTNTGIATGNSLSLSGGTVTGLAIGGYSENVVTAATTSNTVTISGSAQVGSAYGGVSGRLAQENRVSMSGGTVISNVAGAKLQSTGSLSESHKNEVTIYGGEVKGNVYGSYTDSDYRKNHAYTENRVSISNTAKVGGSVYGAAYNQEASAATFTKNWVIISSGGTVNGDAYGAFLKDTASTATVNATGNAVIVSGGTVTGAVYGAYLNNSISTGGTVNASGNTVTIHKGGTVKGNVYGAYSNNLGTLTENKVTLSGPVTFLTGSYNIYGAYLANGGVATNNVVEISDLTFPANVYGAYAETGGTASGNTVTITNGTFDPASGQNNGVVAGGKGASAAENSVTIQGGTIEGVVYGGRATAGDATGNTVNLSNVTVVSLVYGGDAPGGNSDSNSVRIAGGDIQSTVYGGKAFGGTASNNTVTITDGRVATSFDTHVYGGDASATATNNVVKITGGTVGSATNSTVVGGQGASASENSVIIEGGTIEAAVIGGVSNGGTGSASKNTVSITGGTISGDVIGGQINKTGSTANNNTISLSGHLVFGNTTLWGGAFKNGTTGSGDVRTGNTLEIHTSDLTVSNLRNFAQISFYLQDSIANGATLLTLTDPAGTDLSGTTIGVAPLAGGNSPLKTGDSLVLINQSGGTLTTDASLPNTVTAMQGISLLYTFTLKNENNQLTASLLEAPDPMSPVPPVSPIQVNPQTKSLSEAQVAGLSLVNAGNDLASGAGMDNFRAATESVYGLTSFGAMGAAGQRAHTGSYVDLVGGSMMVGLGKRVPFTAGSIHLGAFFEAGYGRFSTHNSFADAASVSADGHTQYYGAGLLGRLDLKGSLLNGVYTEVSLHAGSTKTSYDSNDLRDSFGNKASYDSQAPYFAAHVGLGHVWQMNEALKLDLYGKYFWARQGSDSVTVAGDPVHFKATTSNRARFGARLSGELTEQFHPYAGAAWEYEFDGKSRATTYGYDIASPSFKGGTALGEVGLSWTPSANSALRLEGGVQVYAGKRDGAGGTFQVRYDF